MSSYLDTIYFKNEYDENAYPQKMCNYLAERYIKPLGPLEGMKLLDIGSGKGNHLVGFARLGMETYGLDKRDECINALKDFDIRECNLECDPLPFEDDMFDVVYSKSVLEHVQNTDNLLAQSLRVLKPGGLAIMMTPDWRSQRAYFWDDYTHVKPFTRKGLQNAMRINGFENVYCDYFFQLPLLWKYPSLKIVTSFIKLLPDSLRWKDHEESQFREWIRFGKEEMLLSIGTKP